jgi:hypothetical protein
MWLGERGHGVGVGTNIAIVAGSIAMPWPMSIASMRSVTRDPGTIIGPVGAERTVTIGLP